MDPLAPFPLRLQSSASAATPYLLLSCRPLSFCPLLSLSADADTPSL